MIDPVPITGYFLQHHARGSFLDDGKTIVNVVMYKNANGSFCDIDGIVSFTEPYPLPNNSLVQLVGTIDDITKKSPGKFRYNIIYHVGTSNNGVDVTKDMMTQLSQHFANSKSYLNMHSPGSVDYINYSTMSPAGLLLNSKTTNNSCAWLGIIASTPGSRSNAITIIAPQLDLRNRKPADPIEYCADPTNFVVVDSLRTDQNLGQGLALPNAGTLCYIISSSTPGESKAISICPLYQLLTEQQVDEEDYWNQLKPDWFHALPKRSKSLLYSLVSFHQQVTAQYIVGDATCYGPQDYIDLVSSHHDAFEYKMKNDDHDLFWKALQKHPRITKYLLQYLQQEYKEQEDNNTEVIDSKNNNVVNCDDKTEPPLNAEEIAELSRALFEDQGNNNEDTTTTKSTPTAPDKYSDKSILQPPVDERIIKEDTPLDSAKRRFAALLLTNQNQWVIPNGLIEDYIGTYLQEQNKSFQNSTYFGVDQHMAARILPGLFDYSIATKNTPGSSSYRQQTPSTLMAYKRKTIANNWGGISKPSTSQKPIFTSHCSPQMIMNSIFNGSSTTIGQQETISSTPSSSSSITNILHSLDQQLVLKTSYDSRVSILHEQVVSLQSLLKLAEARADLAEARIELLKAEEDRVELAALKKQQQE